MKCRKDPVPLVIACAVAAISGCHGFSNAMEDLGYSMTDLGYSEVRPPSRLFPPGTVVYVKTRDPFQLAIVCPAARAFGPQFETLVSPTRDQEVSQKLTKRFDIDADYLKALKASASFRDIRNIRFSFANDTLKALSFDNAAEGAKERTQPCQDMINSLLDEKRSVSVIESVIQADVTYSVEWERGAAVGVEILRSLAGKLGIEVSSVGSNTISGQGLFWGARDETLLLNPHSVDPTETRTRLRLVPAARTMISNDPPLVP